MSLYLSSTPVVERRTQCARIAAKYGKDVLPIVLEAVGKYTKVNFTALLPTATVADLQLVVREVGDVSRRSACSLVVGGATPSPETEIGDLYRLCRNEDGFLYVNYMGEKTVGCVGRGSGGVARDNRTPDHQPATTTCSSSGITSAASSTLHMDRSAGGLTEYADEKSTSPDCFSEGEDTQSTS